MEIVFDRASKFYEPGEKVGGNMTITEWGQKWADVKNFTVKSESFMDTVSQIRGNMGRPPLEEKLRTYFMKKSVEFKETKGSKTER
jgi:hypothetical protein